MRFFLLLILAAVAVSPAAAQSAGGPARVAGSRIPGAHRAPAPAAQEELAAAQRSFQAGDDQAGLAAVERAAQLDSLSSVVFESLGSAYQAVGRPRQAYEAFRRASLLDPTSASALNRAGQVLLTQLGRPAGAAAAFRQALAVSPGDAQAHYSLSAYHLLRGEIEETERQADLALRHASEAEQGWFFGARMQLLMLRGEYTQAEDALRRHAAEMPMDFRSQQARALALRMLGRHADAAQVLGGVMAQVRPQAVLFNEMGMLHLGLGRPDSAEAAFARAWELDSTASESGYHLALARLAAGDTGAALQWLDRLERRDPGWYAAALLAGRIHEARGDPARAAAARARARRLHPLSYAVARTGGASNRPSPAESLLVRSEEALVAGDFGVALQLAFRASLDPALRPRALLFASWANRAGGTPQGARVTQLEAVLEGAGSSDRLLRAVAGRELGLAHLRLGNRDDARAVLERALTVLPAREEVSAPAAAALLDLYLQAGDRARARQLAKPLEGTQDPELLAALAREAESAGEAERARSLRERAERARDSAS